MEDIRTIEPPCSFCNMYAPGATPFACQDVLHQKEQETRRCRHCANPAVDKKWCTDCTRRYNSMKKGDRHMVAKENYRQVDSKPKEKKKKKGAAEIADGEEWPDD